jgi:lysophosphatidate acyltransferase
MIISAVVVYIPVEDNGCPPPPQHHIGHLDRNCKRYIRTQTSMAFLLLAIIKPLAYVSLPILILRSISPKARYYINVGIYLGTLVVASSCGATLGLLMYAARLKFDLNAFVARAFYTLAGRVLAIQVTIENPEYLDTRPAVLMVNHQSMLDVLIIGRWVTLLATTLYHTSSPHWFFFRRVFPPKATVLAKKELRWTPLGPFMYFAGALFIDRGNSAQAIQSLADAGRSMVTNSTSLWLYPEGTRTSSETPFIRPFKKGGFHLAVQAGIPIVPVVTENYWRLYHAGVFTSGTIKVRGTNIFFFLFFFSSALRSVTTDRDYGHDGGRRPGARGTCT